MIGLPTKVAFRMTSCRSMPASLATSANDALMASRTALVISLSPPGFIMT